jgi:hypothetical protein
VGYLYSDRCGQDVGMSSSDGDESLILGLIGEFWVAVERGIPREIAALMCAEEAERFLDNVFDPDSDDPVEPIDAPGFEVSCVRVFGDVAFARIIHATGVVRGR